MRMRFRHSQSDRRGQGSRTNGSIGSSASGALVTARDWFFVTFWRTLGMGGVLGNEWRSRAGLTSRFGSTTCVSTKLRLTLLRIDIPHIGFAYIADPSFGKVQDTIYCDIDLDVHSLWLQYIECRPVRVCAIL